MEVNLQFKFATTTDTLVICLGVMMALLAASAMPVFMILRGFAVQVILFEVKFIKFQVKNKTF